MSHQHDFKKLKEFWYQKLEESGFKDIEDNNGYIKTPNSKNNAFHAREDIRDFFIALDHFLNESKSIKGKHRSILEMYSNGFKYTSISKTLKVPYSTVCWVIYKYRAKVIE